MTDKELLELAARAAGIQLTWFGDKDPWCYAEISPGIKWNPLRDPGDALRLAVQLHIGLDFQAPGYSAYWTVLARDFSDYAAATENGPDTIAATMRAITRAAAEIGRAKT